MICVCELLRRQNARSQPSQLQNLKLIIGNVMGFSGMQSLLPASLILFGMCADPHKAEILPWEKYDQASNAAGPSPYVLELKGPTGSLLYVGVAHTYDTESRQIRRVGKEWQSFNPTIALGEGGNLSLRTASREEAIKRHGERGLLRILAS